MYKVIVAHPGRQHSFRVATALKESGDLYKYITTIYDKDDFFLMKFSKMFLNNENKRRASGRKCDSLDDNDVVLFESLLAFMLLLVIRIDRGRKLYNWLNDYISRRFQRKLAYYAMKHDVDAIIAYDSNCGTCFSILKEHGSRIKCIMDNAAPNRNYLYHIYNEHLAKCGPFVKTFKPFKYLWDKKTAQRYADEIKTVDYHIVASSFSKKALLYEGVKDENIFIVPYGMDATRFAVKERCHKDGKLNLLYVGQVNQRKGIYQILEAAKQINNPNIYFNIVGAGVEIMPEVFEPYRKYVTFHGQAYFENLLQHYASNDVFLFPSMGDGFGFVILEAMAAGLPVIASKNSAGSDVIKDEVTGFVIDICDTQALVDKVMWFYNHQDKISYMSKLASAVVYDYTWDNYNLKLVSSINKVLS